MPALPAGMELPPRPAEVREAAAELERAADAADKARESLEETKKDLEEKKAEFEALSEDADANAAKTRQQLKEASAELEEKRAELERSSREAEDRINKAREDLEKLEQDQRAAAAQAGIARGLGRGRGLDMAVAPDPRRARNPAMPPFVPNPAAVAAAGAAGQRGGGNAGAGNVGGGRPPSDQPFPGTAQGDILRGQADLTRAQGEYALDSSTAAINAQTANAMALDNRVRTVETFFEARRLNRINRAFEAGPAVTLEQAVRLAALGLPPRPTPLELDPATGDITWPRLLTESIYHDLTSRIQEHFHRRLAAGGSLDFATAEDCLGSFDQLAARLREQAGRRPAGQHGAAKNFLEGLRREYELPP